MAIKRSKKIFIIGSGSKWRWYLKNWNGGVVCISTDYLDKKSAVLSAKRFVNLLKEEPKIIVRFRKGGHEVD